MAEKNPNRDSYFPTIEKKYGQPMPYWFARMADMADSKYLEQIALLKEDYGFSQAHANALVMYCKGSKSSRRFDTVDEYLAQFDEVKVMMVKKMFKAIMSKFPELELVIAWNQPMLRFDGQYIFGVTVQTNYLLMAPWSKAVLAKFELRLKDYTVNQKTIQVPIDWKVDVKLLQDMAKARLAEVTK